MRYIVGCRCLRRKMAAFPGRSWSCWQIPMPGTKEDAVICWQGQAEATSACLCPLIPMCGLESPRGCTQLPGICGTSPLEVPAMAFHRRGAKHHVQPNLGRRRAEPWPKQAFQLKQEGSSDRTLVYRGP